MNLITSQRTYASYENAERHLSNILKRMSLTLSDVRYLIAVSPRDQRFVPTVMIDERHPERTMAFAHNGVMVIG
jgi:hypothetical protein